MRYAIKIGYDGSHFNGFALQPNKKTVEGEILKRLLKTRIIKGRRESRFQYAARTDKGVHAIGNVIAIDAKVNPIKVLNGMENIWVTGYAVVNKKFNPRHCIQKIYRYYLFNEGYDVDAMKKAAKLMEGEHDFSAFARKDKRNTVRRIDKVEVQRGKIIKIDFYAPSFLWNQVRRMVAALRAAGGGEVSLEEIEKALNGKPANFGVEKADNLVLMDVLYENVEFKGVMPIEIEVKKEIYKDAFDYLFNASNSWDVGKSESME